MDQSDQNLKRTYSEAFFPLKKTPSSNTLIAESKLQSGLMKLKTVLKGSQEELSRKWDLVHGTSQSDNRSFKTAGFSNPPKENFPINMNK